MANVPYTSTAYGVPAGILMFPDGYAGFAHTFDNADSTAKNGIIKAGTIWPANDDTAQGVVAYDVDVTNGSATGTVFFKGAFKVSGLPAAPSDEALGVLTECKFFTAGGMMVAGGTQKSITAITISPASVNIQEDANQQLTVTFTPADTTDPRTVTYKSDHDEFATVNESGLVHGVAAGSATITVTSVAQPSVSKTVSVTVTAKSE